MQFLCTNIKMNEREKKRIMEKVQSFGAIKIQARITAKKMIFHLQMHTLLFAQAIPI